MKKIYQIDAQGKVLGRLATKVAAVLGGKNKVDYVPNVDGGDVVVVTNASQIVVTGRKMKDKKYHRFSGYPGGISSRTFEEQSKINPKEIIRDAVYGMLPKNKLRKGMMKRLKIYLDEKHSHKIDIQL
jgi:large subunit ribosomal protein L13